MAKRLTPKHVLRIALPLLAAATAAVPAQSSAVALGHAGSSTNLASASSCDSLTSRWRAIPQVPNGAALALTNSGPTTCLILGAPSLRAFGRGATSTLADHLDHPYGPAPRIRVRPGGSVWVTVVWKPCRPKARTCVDGRSLRLVAPGSTHATTAALPKRLVVRGAVRVAPGSLRVGDATRRLADVLLYWEGEED